MAEFETVPVVTCFLRNGADVLLLRRSDAVGSYAGTWGAVAGHVTLDEEGDEDEVVDDPGVGDDPTDPDLAVDDPADPDAAARREIAEETGLGDSVELVRAGEPFEVVDAEYGDGGTHWVVHPYLFDVDRRDVTTNEETTEYAWVRPTAILERETVPDLDRSYAAVAPTVESVAADETHGSAYLSVRALEVLRDRAVGFRPRDEEGSAGGTDTRPSWDDLADLALALRDARPGMAAVTNRVNLAMARAAGHGGEAVPNRTASRSAAAVRRAAESGINGALAADERAAAVAADRLADRSVYTLSRSGTVRDALLAGEPNHVLVAESRPGGEGTAVAAALAAAGLDVTLTSDAAAPGIVADTDADTDERTDGDDGLSIDLVLVGADAVFPDGAVVNKVGTHAAGLAAARADVPLFAVCASAKISPDRDFEAGDAGDVGDTSDDRVHHRNPVFEVTPPDLVDGVLAEDGRLDVDAVRERAERYRDLAGWSDVV